MTTTSQIEEIRPGFGADTLVASIDPGERNGLAIWRREGVLLDKAVLSFEELLSWLDSEDHRIKVIVIEDYVLDHRAGRQTGSKLVASQVLGAVKFFCMSHNIEMVVQKNTILRVAAMHARVSIPAKGHIKDDLSAMLHGFYYFEKIGMRARDIQL